MEYIYSRIINLLNDYLYEDRELEWWQWKDMKEDIEHCSSTGRMPSLHEAIVPLYELYWKGDKLLYNPHKYKALEIVKAAIELDGDFIFWASQYNLITLTEDWLHSRVAAFVAASGTTINDFINRAIRNELNKVAVI